MRTYFSKYPKRIEFSKWPDPIDGLPEKLEKGDLILITHAHKDHVKDVTLNRLKRKNTLVFGPKRCLMKVSEDIKEIEPGEEIDFGGIKIKAVDAYNTEKGKSTKKVHYKGGGVGYLITIEEKTIYHAGDTDLIPEMERLGVVDVALLPIGGTYTMDISEAVKATKAIQPKVVIPMHRLKADPLVFKKRVEAKTDTRIEGLAIGEVFHLK